MRRSYRVRRGSRRSVLGALALLAGVFACDAQDTLLEATDPDFINPEAVQNAEGAEGLRVGALARFRTVTAGGESTWLFGGLLADEWSTSSTFVQNDETDQRQVKLDNSSVTGMFRSLNRVRTAANQAIASLRQYRPSPRSSTAEMYFARGFAEMQLAQDFCSGIPLSDAAGEEFVFGKPMTTVQVFERAVASYDSALAFADSTDATAVLVRDAARIGKARALLGLGRYSQAAAEVAGVATTFAYEHTFLQVSGDNIIWSQGRSARRYTVGDSLEGNARNLLVRNAIPFFSARDPRVPVAYTTSNAGRDTTKSQDGFTFSRTTTLYERGTPVAVVNGIDARLVEAEAALQANNPQRMLDILNALRASPPKLGNIQPAAMAALTLPATRDAQVNLLFREKAFWTFSRGQRLGDLRRLIRQYGRTPENTFPVGQHYRGGAYGGDVNLPVVQEEFNNPEFKGCINRNA